MHYASVKWICFLLFVVVGKVAMAEGITSPDGNLRLEFTVNALGEPVYQLFYKEKAVVNPSKLGLELVGDPGLMNGLHLWKPGLQLSMKHGNLCGEKCRRYGIITMSWL